MCDSHLLELGLLVYWFVYYFQLITMNFNVSHWQNGGYGQQTQILVDGWGLHGVEIPRLKLDLVKDQICF